MKSIAILEIKDDPYYPHWTLIIDLYQINQDLGRKEKDPFTGKTFTVYKVRQVQKLFKLCNRYGRDLDEFDELMKATFPKLWKYWKEAMRYRR